LAAVYQKLNQYEEAEQAYQKSIEVGNYYRAYENLSDLLLRIKDFKGSVEVSEKGLKIYPLNSRLWLLLAISNYQSGDDIEAIIAVKKLISIEPTEYNRGIAEFIIQNKPIKIEFLK
jgi:tetratricopeptide (TPR) repeat protein